MSETTQAETPQEIEAWETYIKATEAMETAWEAYMETKESWEKATKDKERAWDAWEKAWTEAWDAGKKAWTEAWEKAWTDNEKPPGAWKMWDVVRQ